MPNHDLSCPDINKDFKPIELRDSLNECARYCLNQDISIEKGKSRLGTPNARPFSIDTKCKIPTVSYEELDEPPSELEIIPKDEIVKKALQIETLNSETKSLPGNLYQKHFKDMKSEVINSDPPLRMSDSFLYSEECFKEENGPCTFTCPQTLPQKAKSSANDTESPELFIKHKQTHTLHNCGIPKFNQNDIYSVQKAHVYVNIYLS